jgi:putative phosphoesterase
MPAFDQSLPPAARENLIATVGLIADTHFPERCAVLPPAIFSILQDVDLILHAGDVGTLTVLDKLSMVAPVAAVHGNDDTVEAQSELPFQQVVTISNQRILLTHGHFPDLAQEQAIIQQGTWQPLLQQHTARAHRAGARFFISGHTHVPIFTLYDNVWLINPGAIAPGTYKLRQSLPSIAILYVMADRPPLVQHINLITQEVFTPQVDFEIPFVQAHNQFAQTIIDAELESIWTSIKPLRSQVPEAFHQAILRSAHRVWAGEQPMISKSDLWAELQHQRTIPADVLSEFERLLVS